MRLYAVSIIPLLHLIGLAAIFFLTCIVTVVTGGTSLITVPVMIQFGISARTALATNMVTLLMMSIGGCLPFIRGPEIDRPRAPLLIGLTIAGSVIGTTLVFMVPVHLLPVIIPIAMVVVLIFLLANPRIGLREEHTASRSKEFCGYGAALFLSVYAGFFSGGYVTMLMAACVFFFGYTLLRAMVMARLMNVAASFMATCLFAWHGTVQWPLSLALGAAGFAGASIGARWAKRAPRKLLRAVFLTAVAVLALKALVFDAPWHVLFKKA